MNRLEYIKEIEKHIKYKVSSQELKEIVNDYAEFFDESRKQGRSDEDIMKSLGDPKQLAKEIISTDVAVTSMGASASSKKIFDIFTRQVSPDSNKKNTFDEVDDTYKEVSDKRTQEQKDEMKEKRWAEKKDRREKSEEKQKIKNEEKAKREDENIKMRNDNNERYHAYRMKKSHETSMIGRIWNGLRMGICGLFKGIYHLVVMCFAMAMGCALVAVAVFLMVCAVTVVMGSTVIGLFSDQMFMITTILLTTGLFLLSIGSLLGGVYLVIATYKGIKSPKTSMQAQLRQPIQHTQSQQKADPKSVDSVVSQVQAVQQEEVPEPPITQKKEAVEEVDTVTI